MAQFTIENLGSWKINVVKPNVHKREHIVETMKPVLRYLYEANYLTRKFTFDGWDLFKQVNDAGCPCGKRLLRVAADLKVFTTPELGAPELGIWNEDLLSIIDHPNNAYYKDDIRPDICKKCELLQICAGGCRINHWVPEMLKERCDALKELMNYCQLLKE